MVSADESVQTFMIQIDSLNYKIEEFVTANADKIVADFDGDDRNTSLTEYLNTVSKTCVDEDIISTVTGTIKMQCAMITNVLIYQGLYYKFKSLPETYNDALPALLGKLFTEDSGVDVDAAFTMLDNVIIYANSLLDVVKADEWSMVDFELTNNGNVLLVRVGKCVYEHVFKELFGTARWKGPAFNADGTLPKGEQLDYRSLLDIRED